MNYLTMPTSNQNSSQKFTNSLNMAQINPANNVLRLINLALSTDFSRYANAISTKIMLQELLAPKNQPRTEPPRPRIHSQPPLREKQPKQSVPKPIQKSQPIKTASVPKQQNPKASSVPAPPAPQSPIPQKNIKKPAPEKVVSSKIKKKIHKIPEAKKENPGRVPRVSLVQTAEISRSGMSEKERRKIKERLLIRQVKEWRLAEQFKRDRRDLRPLQ